MPPKTRHFHGKLVEIKSHDGEHTKRVKWCAIHRRFIETMCWETNHSDCQNESGRATDQRAECAAANAHRRMMRGTFPKIFCRFCPEMWDPSIDVEKSCAMACDNKIGKVKNDKECYYVQYCTRCLYQRVVMRSSTAEETEERNADDENESSKRSRNDEEESQNDDEHSDVVDMDG